MLKYSEASYGGSAGVQPADAPILLLGGYPMGKYFGTDGFRGEAGRELTAEHAFRIGQVLGHYYKKDGKRPRAVIGKDTRRSSYMLEYAVAAGLSSVGADAYMLHVITTPGVAYVTRTEGFDVGVMISASHNPFYDNGIKVISSDGEKLSDSEIDELEAMMDGGEIPAALGSDVGRITDHYSGRNRYVGYLISLAHHSFRTLRIGLDCSNGAAFTIAPSVFRALGAEVHTTAISPDGVNINDGVGSTHIESLVKLVRENKLDMGFAFDGDADRCIAVDSDGEVVCGDRILYVLASGMRERGELADSTLVATVMSNLGLLRTLDAAGLGYELTTVGDRYVYERMKERGYTLGGEQSGHVIISKYATTGDGILTAIQLTEACLEAKESLAKLHAPVRMLPQTTVSVRVRSKSAADTEATKAAARKIEERLGKGGRLLLRKSGTEPVVRVMVEAVSKAICEQYVSEIVNMIHRKGYSIS